MQKAARPSIWIQDTDALRSEIHKGHIIQPQHLIANLADQRAKQAHVIGERVQERKRPTDPIDIGEGVKSRRGKQGSGSLKLENKLYDYQSVYWTG